MFSTDFIFRQQENLVDNQKCQAGFRPLCNKILFLILIIYFRLTHIFVDIEDMQILHVESSYLNSSNMLHNQVQMLALYRIVSKLEYVISFLRK